MTMNLVPRSHQDRRVVEIWNVMIMISVEVRVMICVVGADWIINSRRLKSKEENKFVTYYDVRQTGNSYPNSRSCAAQRHIQHHIDSVDTVSASP